MTTNTSVMGVLNLKPLEYQLDHLEFHVSARYYILQLLQYIKKLLNSDWSRAVQLIPNCTPFEYLICFHGNGA